MKILTYLFLLTIFCSTSSAQNNCSVFTDSSFVRACRLANASNEFAQGSRNCQLYLDSAIRICPNYAEAWREFGVPFLKRGDFYTWRRYIDRAVQLKPRDFLGIRGWCRFKFLKDYTGALEDLKRYDTITNFNPRQTGDGVYSLYIVMALCERELGNYHEALSWFAKGIDSMLIQKGDYGIGLFDYLHRAVLKMKMKDYAGALSDLEKQIRKYEKFAENWYYKGLVLQTMNRQQEARDCFDKARRLFVSDGYHFSDPYCEVTDVVYLSDIDEAIRKPIQ
jgi:tetratricopeptide (TPR) repeat protein